MKTVLQHGDNSAIFVLRITGCKFLLFVTKRPSSVLNNRSKNKPAPMESRMPNKDLKVGIKETQGLQCWQSRVGSSRWLEAKCNPAPIAENNRNHK